MAVNTKSETRTVALADAAATGRLAVGVAPVLRAGDVVALRGELGAGKTTFARALIRTLCETPDEVPSPTFTLLQTYAAAEFEIWHFDLYRLARPEDAFELGIEEAFAGGVTLIEWPERLGRFLPANRLEIHLEYADGDTGRIATLSGAADWPERIGALDLD